MPSPVEPFRQPVHLVDETQLPVGPHQPAGTEGPGVEGAVGQRRGGVDVADEVLGKEIRRTLHPHEPLGARQLELAGGDQTGPALGAGGLAGQAVEVAAGQADRR